VVKDETFAHVSIARGPVEVISLSSSTSTNAYMFPLYRYVSEALLSTEDRRVVNLSAKFLKRLAETTAYSWKESGRNKANASVFGPEDVVAYIYALLHANSYRQWFGDELLRDFPVIPLPGSGALFASLVPLGNTLVSYHLLEQAPAKTAAKFVGTPARALVERVSYEDHVVWLDKKRSVGFQGVPDAVWGYHVGGYQVLEKWLKSRKGRNLSKADIEHFLRVVGVLGATLTVAAMIETTLQSHGGWPGAFVTKPAEAKK
jgi:predicted helicase